MSLFVMLLAGFLAGCAPSGSGLGNGSGSGSGSDSDSEFERTSLTSPWHDGETENLSDGCFTSADAMPDSVEVHGRTRYFIARVPSPSAPGTPLDLIVAFHGRTNSNAQVRRYYDLEEVLPDAVILYPSALPDGNAFRWSDPGDSPRDLRDFAFLEALIVRVGAAVCLDLERVFVVGHSLGASFANSIACHRGGQVRAVASVAGGLHGGSECEGGTAALLIHHPEDRLTPFNEGIRARDSLLIANGLTGPPVPASEPELMALGCERYGPDSPHPVLWCAHSDSSGPGGRYYPHTWPDAAPLAIARFFGDLR